MNDKQKQIEEMAKEFSPYRAYCNSVKCEECVHQKMSKCRYYSFAKRFFLNGYRKQSDTVREIVERLKELLHKHEYRNQTDGVPFYQMNAESFCDEINELAAEYGVEVEE